MDTSSVGQRDLVVRVEGPADVLPPFVAVLRVIYLQQGAPYSLNQAKQAHPAAVNIRVCWVELKSSCQKERAARQQQRQLCAPGTRLRTVSAGEPLASLATCKYGA